MAQRHDDIRAINHLISLTLDSAEHYRKAMSEVRSAELTQRFRRRCRERLATSNELRQHVDAMGGDPKDDGSVLGPLQRGLSNLFYAMRNTDGAVVAEVDRYENRLLQKYVAVLSRCKLSDRSREAVLHAYETVRNSYEELAQLKHSFRFRHS